MTTHPVTIHLSDPDFQRVQEAAERTQQPTDRIVAEALAIGLPILETYPDQLKDALAHMVYLNDAALWQASRTTLTPDQRERLEELHHKQQRIALSPEEITEEQALLRLYRETQLVRARAVLLLQQRNYDANHLSFCCE